MLNSFFFSFFFPTKFAVWYVVNSEVSSFFDNFDWDGLYLCHHKLETQILEWVPSRVL
jgi:hypothetical protein